MAALALACLTVVGQTVKGRVTSGADQTPLPGVSVILKGTSTGTTTDANGTYSVSVANLENGVLSFSFIGFATQDIPVNNQTTIDIVMVEDATQLGEVVVTALGIEREQKALGYAVSTVTSEQINRAGNTNFASALYGKAAGVRISSAPGGATSAVNVQIRGINSMKFNSQPLYVVDGVLIRNMNEAGQDGLNNGGYWSDQKIRGNGVLDINPADIETLTILKGASATALYGSEAASGVIVITTKKGSRDAGLGVDVNYNFTVEQVAFTPKFQNVYGPGYDRETNLALGANEDGWIPVDLDGNGSNESLRPYFRAYGQFGPKMEGQLVSWWDGSMKNFSPRPDNYKELFQTGSSSTFNAAVSNNTDKGSFRISYTRLDYEGISRGSSLERNTFNLNSTLKLSNKISMDIIVNYFNSHVHNRPEQINRLTANYGGFFSRTDDIGTYLDKYKTSAGYKWVPYNITQRNPEEALRYHIRAYDLLDYFWRNLRNSEDEFQDRLITSATLKYDITKSLTFRGRVGNDFTTVDVQNQQYNEYPSAFNDANSSTGYYGTRSSKYQTLYSDAMLSYNKDVTPDITVGLSAGTQVRSEKYKDHSSSTNGGLVVENWFSLNNSKNQLQTSLGRMEVLKYAYLGIANFSYKEFLFLEGTARQEYSSTFPPGENDYFYPSVNAGFVFTEAFRLPVFLSYGKVRASYGVVGNAPPPYAANITYAQTTLQTSGGPVSYLSSKNSYGNNKIRPENKYESEFGLETRIFEGKLGLDVTYYNSKVVDQILPISLSPTNGATEILANVGELHSDGLEVAVNATPMVRGDFRWDTRFNFATTKTRVHKLMEGMDRITFYNADAGAVQIRAEEGETLGNIYVHPRETDDNGNFIINDDGYYVLSDEYVQAGNVLPKVVGGLANTFSYEGLSLDIMLDYRYGGKLVSAPLLYGKGAGLYENTLQYRDEAHGGLPYYIDGDNNKVLLSGHGEAAPDGSRVYHDGVMLKGVTTSGEANAKLVDAAAYYMNSFGWASGWYENGAIFDNDYIKVREVALGYNLPKALTEKLHFQNIRVSLIGRNLFYVYRTLENLDPEVAIGSRWDRQGVDEGSMAANRSYGFAINARF